jgi:antitoxin component of MazEF toxin-antitoxin module
MQFPLMISKYTKLGGSWGLILPPAVRSALGLLPGDMIAIRLLGNRAVIGRLVPGVVLPLSVEETVTAVAVDMRAAGR